LGIGIIVVLLAVSEIRGTVAIPEWDVIMIPILMWPALLPLLLPIFGICYFFDKRDAKLSGKTGENR